MSATAQPVALILIPAAALAAPLLADRPLRWIAVPIVVFEIVLGVLIGSDVLGWAHVDDLVNALSQFGLAMLVFLAGYEIDLAKLRGGPLKRAGTAWLGSLVLALGVGALVNRNPWDGAFAGLVLTTTALGTILPALRDSGELPTPFGSLVMATGAVGEFGPIIAIAVLLSGNSPARTAIILDAFTAGIVSRLLLSDIRRAEEEVIEAKLESIGFGFLVPIFFVVSGMNFDLDALLDDPGTLLLVPVFPLLFLAVRGVPAALLAPAGLGRRDRTALGLYGATALPLVVVITTTEVEAGHLPSSTAAALVGAGMLSVLVFPLVAQRVRGGVRPATAAGAERPRVRAESW
ncbi:cation:proton antiporter [Kitasatospora sp. NPDC127059]|uniref:cation:proton antiporter n=1 Tax=unclassified Kitasatospora TaxID=2633591 RepID=UPI003650C84D